MRKPVALISCLCLGVVVVLSFTLWQDWQIQGPQIERPKFTFRAARETFPFSVIPGGIQNTRELADSMMKDEVVREHYMDVNPSGMWFKRLKQPMLAYVSFRDGSRIGWTTHPVTIAANELVLTDGKRMVRARCGNRIEVQRPDPLPAIVEVPKTPPPDIALDTGIPGVVPPSTETPIGPRSDISTLVDHGDTQLIATAATPVGPPTTVTPPTTGTPPGGVCCGVIPPACCGTTRKRPEPVPEPSSLLLLGAGAIGIWMAGRKLRRK